MITIVDYGLGNVKAIANIYKNFAMPVTIASHADELKKADKIILPGVGAFDQAIQLLEKSGMRRTLDEMVTLRQVPILGICIGMQMFAMSSQEGKLPGLGWLDAEVKRFDPLSFAFPACVPHMGWNDIEVVRENDLFLGLEENTVFYFLHSYYMDCQKSEEVIAIADYGEKFACAVSSGNIFGVQFHPEKSHQYGTQLLKNFSEL